MKSFLDKFERMWEECASYIRKLEDRIKVLEEELVKYRPINEDQKELFNPDDYLERKNNWFKFNK